MKRTITLLLLGALALGLLTGCGAKGGSEAVSVESVGLITGVGAVGMADSYAGKVVSGETAEVKKGATKKVEDFEKKWANYEAIAASMPELSGQVGQCKEAWKKFRASYESTMGIAETGDSVGGLAEYNRSMKKATVDLRDGLAKLLKTADKPLAVFAVVKHCFHIKRHVRPLLYRASRFRSRMR